MADKKKKFWKLDITSKGLLVAFGKSIQTAGDSTVKLEFVSAIVKFFTTFGLELGIAETKKLKEATTNEELKRAIQGIAETTTQLELSANIASDNFANLEELIQDHLDKFDEGILNQNVLLNEIDLGIRELKKKLKEHDEKQDIEHAELSDEHKRILEKIDNKIYSGDNSNQAGRDINQDHSKNHHVIHNIPHQSLGSYFKGRDNVFWTLAEKMGRKDVSAITQSISGLGGIGKTRLAIEYSWYALENKLYSAILFVNCSREIETYESNDSIYDEELLHENERKTLSAKERLFSEMTHLSASHLLNIKSIETVKPKIAMETVLRDIHALSSYLVVFDNVDDVEMANAVNDIIPQLYNGKVIITSRLSNLPGEVFTLEKLSRQASIDYLLDKTCKKRRKQKIDDKKVNELAKMLDGLPVALEQAAAYIICQEKSFDEYLNDLCNIEHEVMEFRARDTALSQYPFPVLLVWHVTEKNLSSIACALLIVSSFLAPEDIPYDLLENQSKSILEIASNHLGKNKREKQMRDTRAVRKAIAELAGYSMINNEHDGNRFHIHRLVQSAIRLQLGSKHFELYAGLVLEMLANETPEYTTEIETVFSWHKKMESHIAWIISFTETLWPDIMSIPISSADYIGSLMNNLALLYAKTNRLTEAEALLNKALVIGEKRFADKAMTVSSINSNLGDLYRVTNRFAKAEPLLKRAIEISERKCNQKTRWYNSLADLYRATNLIEEADVFFEKANAIAIKAYAKIHPKLIIKLNDLIDLLENELNSEKLGLLDKEEIDIGMKAIADKSEYGNLTSNIILPKMNSFIKKAKKCYEEAITLAENNLLYTKYDRNVRLLPTMNKDIPGSNSKNSIPIENVVLKRVLDRSKNLSTPFPDMIIQLNSLAEYYNYYHRFDESENIFYKNIKKGEIQKGSYHPNVATFYNNLASLYFTIGRFDEAEMLYNRVLYIFESSLNRNHPSIAIVLNNIASLYRLTNRKEEAIQLYIRALGIDKQRYNEAHPEVARDLNNLAELYKDNDCLEKAEPLYRRAIEIYMSFKRNTGYQHTFLVTVIFNYSGLLLKMGEDNVQIFKKIRGIDPEIYDMIFSDSY